jgi:UDP-N-acetylglucosamine diphosphorylase / glucose-1-phosphate thymidylyltransferase / UDP-N-acetylgalactosamine diphosphorylase / glucosamine-1-phosphate N-acetyltransferase / galactosamine-1-phosphate N-acetyltransferase
MRLILFDGPDDVRAKFYPLSLCRPVWDLRCGITSQAEKLVSTTAAKDVACFVPAYMAEAYRQRTSHKVNDLSTLGGDDLFVVHGTVKAATLTVPPTGRSEIGLIGDVVAYIRVAKTDLSKLDASSFEAFLSSARKAFPSAACEARRFEYVWDLMLESPHQIIEDFKAAGRSGIEGTIEEPAAIRGDRKNVYVAKGCLVHPMAVVDASNGPVYLDEGVEVHPFTRIEGPAFVGKKSILLGTKLREGCSVGPMCRLGGEVEESVIQGYSNKYHDGFLGHAYVGEWVNLGALTTNSDLKNDYTSVEVIQNGKKVDTKSTKVGAMIGDHTKTSIGTLMNTGAMVGSMALIMATGEPVPKSIPSFSWFVNGVVTKGFGRKALYKTAATAMSRRKQQWTAADEAMWEAIHQMTRPERDEAIKRGRRMAN